MSSKFNDLTGAKNDKSSNLKSKSEANVRLDAKHPIRLLEYHQTYLGRCCEADQSCHGRARSAM